MATGTNLHKLLALLEHFTERRPALTAQEIGRLMRLPTSTTYRLLGALRGLQLLEYARETRQYRLGSRLFELGMRFYKHLDLARAARPIMLRLAVDSSETAVLTRLHEGRIVCLDKTESSQIILFSIQPGTEMPFYAGAASRVILAFLSRDELKAAEHAARRAHPRLRRPPRLDDELEHIRKRGYAFTKGTVVPEAWAISAPLVDGFGRAVGSLSVAGPVYRLNAERIEPLARRVIAAAEEIAATLGPSLA
jgi:DNA-binding IclR family transcriptional regulator